MEEFLDHNQINFFNKDTCVLEIWPNLWWIIELEFDEKCKEDELLSRIKLQGRFIVYILLFDFNKVYIHSFPSIM